MGLRLSYSTYLSINILNILLVPIVSAFLFKNFWVNSIGKCTQFSILFFWSFIIITYFCNIKYQGLNDNTIVFWKILILSFSILPNSFAFIVIFLLQSLSLLLEAPEILKKKRIEKMRLSHRIKVHFPYILNIIFIE